MSLGPAQPPDEYPSNPDSSLSHFAYRQYIPEAITAALPIVVTITNHGLQNGQAIRATKFYATPAANATGMYQLNNRLFYVQQSTNNTLQLYSSSGEPIDGRTYTPYISGGLFTLSGPTLPIVNPAPEPP